MRLANSDTKPQGSLITTGPDPESGVLTDLATKPVRTGTVFGVSANGHRETCLSNRNSTHVQSCYELYERPGAEINDVGKNVEKGSVLKSHKNIHTCSVHTWRKSFFVASAGGRAARVPFWVAAHSSLALHA
jgi:hypothetical protein